MCQTTDRNEVGIHKLYSLFCPLNSELLSSVILHGEVNVKNAQSCPTVYNPIDPTRLLCPWNSPGKNSEVGCPFLLQGIFPIQGLNLGLLPC